MAKRPPATWAAIAAILLTSLNFVPNILRGIGLREALVITGTRWSLVFFGVALVFLLYRLFVDCRKATPAASLPEISPAPIGPTANCSVDGEPWPAWFTLHIPETGETFCLAHLDGKPYPIPGETEHEYVARWIRDGKPVRNP